jgi:hypothetical protein
MQARSDPGCRFIIPDPVHPVHDLDPLGRTPAGDEGIRERHIAEIDGQRIIDDAARAGWSRGPTIGTTIFVSLLRGAIGKKEFPCQRCRSGRDPRRLRQQPAAPSDSPNRGATTG